jgi:thiol-disulfide isomerase/thioredoxin
MFSPSYGILGKAAPAWEVARWYNLPAGRSTVELEDYSGHVVYLFCFQSWCPGCHSSGFPALLAVMDMFRDAQDVSFVAVQTVFEGFEANTAAKAQETAERYQLTIPVGHDAGPDDSGSVLMRNYRTGGTPWTVVVGKDGYVHLNDFHVPIGPVCQLIEMLRER